MGNAYGYKCKRCGYEFYLSFGFGMLGHQPFFEVNERTGKLGFYELESDTVVRELEKLYASGNIISGGGRYDTPLDAYYCENCHKEFSKQNFRIEHTGGIYEPEYTCEGCGTVLTHLIIEGCMGLPEIWQCHDCGCREYVCTDEILFD
jgi:hypothetical protein